MAGTGGRILRSLIVGAPGSGKGTISSRIVRDFKLAHLASGDLLRNQIAANTEVGTQAHKYIKDGQLVPDGIITKLMASELQSMNTSWLLDGFPRTLPQAEALNSIENVDLVLNLDVPFDTIRSRLEARWIHEPSGRVYNLNWSPPKNEGLDDVTGEPLTQREDDKPATVQRRLKTYEDMTKPLLDFYSNIGVLHSFSGTESDVMYPVMKEFLDGYLQDFHKSKDSA